MRLRLLFSSILVLFCLSGIGQIRYHSTDAKAIKSFEKGLEAYNKKEDDNAIKFMEAAIERDPNFYEAYEILSRLYYEKGDNEASLRSLYKMVEVDPKANSTDWYYIGMFEKENQNFKSALIALDNYLEVRDTQFERMEVAVRAKADCEFAIWAMENPVPYEPVNLGENINSPSPEYLPCLTADDQHLIFTRRIMDGGAPDGSQDNLYYSNKGEDGNWQLAQPMREINTIMNEGAASISADGNTLVFTACSFYDDYGPGRTGKGSCDLFISQREGKYWGQPMNMGDAINTANWESQPSLSSDGNELYFIRAPKRRDKEANQEIYVAKRNAAGQWEKAKKLPVGINTPYKEETVLIHPDGQTLYFSSNGHPGMGGLDIFMSRRKEDGSWGEVKNLGYPINTADDENSLLVSTDGQLAYFSSNMEGGIGSFDIYAFKLYPEAQPQMVTFMKGKVFDKDNKELLGASFELIDLHNNKVVYSGHSGMDDGRFLVPITAGNNYALNVSKEGYLFFSEHFQLEERASNEPYLMDVPLMKIAEGSEVVLRNVFFETDQSELKEESIQELMRLKQLLVVNTTMSIEVEGHTDDQGSKSRNQDLSTERAKAVFEFLIAEGIDKSRLQYKGYADERPISSNETEEGRALNRRTSIRILAK